MIIRKIRLTEYEYQPPINYVAGATEPDIQFRLADYTIPAGATARCYVQRFDGTFEYTVATINGNNVTVEPTSSMFSVRGEGAIQITLYAGEEVLKTFSVPVFVHADLADENAEQGSDVTGIFRAAEEQALEEFQEQAEQIAENVIESIPEDYTALTEEVTELNERLGSLDASVEIINNEIFRSEEETVEDIYSGEFAAGETIGIDAGESASKIFHTQKNMFCLFDRAKGTGGSYSPSTQRVFTEGEYYNGFESSGACNGNGWSTVTYDSDGVTVAAGTSGGGGGNGALFPFRVVEGLSYTLSGTIYGDIKILYYGSNGVYKSYESAIRSVDSATDASYTFTPPTGAYWTCLLLASHSTRIYTYKNLQVETGLSKSTYEDYNGEILPASTEELTAYSGLNKIWTDGGEFTILGTKISKMDELAESISELSTEVTGVKAVTDVVGETIDVEYTNEICVEPDCAEDALIDVSASDGATMIMHSKKNLFNLFDRSKGSVSGSAATNPRAFKPDEYYNGFTATGTQAGDGYSTLEYITGGIKVTPGASGGGGGYGTLFPIHLPYGKTYTLSLNIYGSAHVAFYDASGVYMSYVTGPYSGSEATDKTLTFTPPEGAYWTAVLFQNHATRLYEYKNVQIELAEASEYEEYEGEILPVSTEQITAYGGTNFIWTDKGVLSVKKNKIVKKINDLEEWAIEKEPLIEKLENDVIHRNLDVLPAVQACVSYGIHSAGSANNKRSIGLLVTTDVHAQEQVMRNAVDYFNEYPYIDYGMCLGDMAGSYYSDTDGTWYTGIVNQANKPFYTVIGNHDGGNGTSASQNATVEQSFNKWIKPTRDVMDMPNLSVPYYAVHDATYGVSMIFLNSYDVPDTVDGSGDFVVSRGVNAYSQDQIDWFINELASVPQYNHLVLIQHIFAGESTVQQCPWSQKWGSIADTASYGEMIQDIINAWITGGTLSDTYTTDVTGLPDLDVDADFTSRGTGVFACHLAGHVHKDFYCKSAKYSNQNVISFVCTADGYWQGEANDLPRVENTKSQDAFTIVSINKAHMTINLARVGSNKTISMTDRTMYAIPY